MLDGAVLVSYNLDLNMPGIGKVFFYVDLVVAKSCFCFRLAAPLNGFHIVSCANYSSAASAGRNFVAEMVITDSFNIFLAEGVPRLLLIPTSLHGEGVATSSTYLNGNKKHTHPNIIIQKK